jgi:hypothetical protein
MTIVVAPTLAGYPVPGTGWRPDQRLAVMRGEAADCTTGTPAGPDDEDT